MKDRQKSRYIFEAAMQDLTDAGVISVDANDSGAAIVFAVWIPPEDVEKFLADLQRAATQRKTTIDLYGPPRYARSTTGGRP